MSRNQLFCEQQPKEGKAKNKKPSKIEGSVGAVDRNRTGDLIPTKDVLYRLSYNSAGDVEIIVLRMQD